MMVLMVLALLALGMVIGFILGWALCERVATRQGRYRRPDAFSIYESDS